MAQHKYSHAERSPPALEREETRKPVDGWAAYRSWLTGSPAVPRERNRPDHSIYTWKGYKNWSEKIRRSWVDES